MHQRWL
jgi:hypothetical protein